MTPAHLTTPSLRHLIIVEIHLDEKANVIHVVEDINNSYITDLNTNGLRDLTSWALNFLRIARKGK